MATDVTIYVDPDATGSNNGTSWVNAYTSLITAYSTEAKDITSSDEIYIFLCRNSGGSALAFGTLSGFTTDSTRYTVIRADEGYEALKTGWVSTRVRLEDTDQIMTFGDNYIRVEGFQLKRNYSSVGFKWTTAFPIPSGGSDIRFLNCRFEGNGDDSSFNYINYCTDSDANISFINCIIYNSHREAFYITAGTVNIYNCIVSNVTYASGNGIRINSGPTVSIYNTAVFNTPDDFQDAASSTIDHCASDDGDGTNAVAPSGADWDNEFADSGNGDFTLLNTGNLYQGGTNDPSSGLYSTDIEGDSYNSPWDIGVDSYAAAGGLSIPVAINNMRQQGVA